MVDQEEARLENSEAILRNLVSEFKAQGIKIKVVDEDTIAYKGVQFDLMDTPTDTLNGIIYLISPSNQSIPVREENLAETVKMVVDYVEQQRMQKSLRKGASAYATFEIEDFDNRFFRANDGHIFYCPCGRGTISTYTNSIDVNRIGEVVIFTSNIKDEVSAEIQSDSADLEEEIRTTYLDFESEPESWNVVFNGFKISSVFVATEGVSINARKFTANAGGWSRANLSGSDLIDCDGSWYLDVGAVLDYTVNGMNLVAPYDCIISVDPQLWISSESAEAHNNMWDSDDDDGYYASTKKSKKLSKFGCWNNASGSKPNVVLDADDIRQPIRDWYTSAYPDDDLGMNLSDITFHDLHTGISQGLDVYDHIGVGDSTVRERLFNRLAQLKSVSYNTIYDMWLNGMRKGMRKSMPNSRLVDKVAQIIERELPNVSFVGDSMGYEPDIYDWVEGYIYETNQNVDEPWVDVESAEDLAEMILDSINGSYDSTVQTPNGDSIRMITKMLSKNMRKSGKGLKKYAPNIKKLPNPVLLTYDNHTIEVPYQYDPYDSWDKRYTELDMGRFIVAISIASSDPFTVVQYHINVLDSQTRGGLDGAESYHGKMDIDYAISSGFHEVSDALDHAINGAKLSNIKGGAYWYHDEDNPLLPYGYYQYEDGEWVSKSKKLSKNSINALADRIAMDCQCDSAEVHNLNGEDILMMPVMDSDCEGYYEEYDIYQEEMDGVTYNCVNLSRMNKGVRKHTMLSKNESIPSFSQMMKSVKDGSPIGLFRERF